MMKALGMAYQNCISSRYIHRLGYVIVAIDNRVGLSKLGEHPLDRTRKIRKSRNIPPPWTTLVRQVRYGPIKDHIHRLIDFFDEFRSSKDLSLPLPLRRT
jgi:hypothetical protein